MTPRDREDGLVPAGRLSPSGQLLEQAEPGTPAPGAGSERLSAPGRAPRTPAGAVRRAEAAAPAGPKALRGAEWRQAVKAAQAKTRRRKTTPAANPAIPLPNLPAASGVPLTATADCGGCDWTAGPGTGDDVDKAAEKHVRVGHPTVTIAEPEAGAA